jgi:hypothetical protein
MGGNVKAKKATLDLPFLLNEAVRSDRAILFGTYIRA